MIFSLKQQSILNESEQTLKDMQRIYDDYISLVTEIITQLRSFLEDPYFEIIQEKEQTTTNVSTTLLMIFNHYMIIFLIMNNE